MRPRQARRTIFVEGEWYELQVDLSSRVLCGDGGVWWERIRAICRAGRD
jgi:hypothetical protein